MIGGPFLGVVLHSVGGVAHGTFYAPLHKIKKWSWESGWLVQGMTAWVVVPWVVAICAGTNPVEAISNSPFNSVLWTYLFGIMWWFGSLTFGLTMRYLGMSLGMAVALGFCATFGTLLPPILSGDLSGLLGSNAGYLLLGGIAVCLLGIGQCGYAGMRKERELTDEQKKEGIKEFALGKGFLVAVFSGIMSAGFAYAITAGKPVAEASLQSGAPDILKNAPVFILVMAGGFTVNCIWCVILNIKNRSYTDYLGLPGKMLGLNLLFAATAGTIWYTGFFFYGMGTTFMGAYDFSSWSIHMAFVIMFSTICGIAMKEWKGVTKKTMSLVFLGLVLLLLSTVITATGNSSAAH
ncbi:MAG: rhamnose/proton symporter RhaT [Candidatus Brocadiia bacterium]|nr:MAG: rhamnose/proton symporter RhaT [Candidatus Brocadiia bacterium]